MLVKSGQKKIELQKLGSQEPTKLVKTSENLPSFLDQPVVRQRLLDFSLDLLPWQQGVLQNSLAIKNSSLFYKNVCLSVPRQNGKTEIIVARAFIGLIFLSEKMVYSSYREESAVAIFYRMLDLIESSPESLRAYFPELPSRKVKEKVIVSRDPHTNEILGRIRFITRKGGAGRGLSESLVFIDEAQNLTAGENDSLSGTIATFKNGQLWYFGTPEPAEAGATLGTSAQSSQRGENLFGIIRKNILKGLPYSLWAEWGIEKILPKTEKSAWYIANPSLGYSFPGGRGITEEYLASRTADDLSFAVEHLGFWSEQQRDSVIDITSWDDLSIKKEEIQVFKSGKVSLAIKSSVDDQKIYVTLASRKKGSNEVFTELLKVFDLSSAWEAPFWTFIEGFVKSSKCVSIAIDGVFASSQVKNILSQRGVWKPNGPRFKQGKILFVSTGDLTSACSTLLGSIKERKLFHAKQPVVDQAIFDTGKRSLKSGGFGFYSISGKTDPALVESIALAVAEASKQRITQLESAESNQPLVTKFGNVTKF